MKDFRLHLMSAVFGLLVLYGQTATARVIAGGCSNSFPHFATIQGAVNAAAAGDTVLICAGTYPEQVTITKALTLRALDDEEDEVVITSPATGMVANTVDGMNFPVAALIAVKQATHVYIRDLTLDASNNQFGLGCTKRLAGISYLASSGIGDNLEIRNVLQEDPTCRTGTDFRVDNPPGGTSVVALQGSSIGSYFAFGVVAVGTGANLTVKENSVFGLGDTSVISQGGIEITGGATGTIIANRVTNNTKSDAFFQSTGIFANGGHGVLIGGNDVRGNLFGISLQTVTGFDADNAVIAFNTVSKTGRDGIWICSNNNVVDHNLIKNS